MPRFAEAPSMVKGLSIDPLEMSGVDIFPIIIFSDGPVIQSEITALETDSASFVRVMV
jgi:hypothetical protein